MNSFWVALCLCLWVCKSFSQTNLHDAQDITQTQAQLSADFSQSSQEHGFQYKKGSLTVLDAFSQMALDKLSDPIKIETSGKVWKSRDVKGWVESNSSLSAGQSSTMTTKVELFKDTEMSFDWSVDSEKDKGILSFIVDGKVVKEISGEIPFTKVAYTIKTGKHTLSWSYKKTTSTNVGLDLGMVRNINIQNTTAGEWNTVKIAGNSLNLKGLTPGVNYLYRGFGNSFTAIKQFKTKSISIASFKTSSLTQTKVTLSEMIENGDAAIDTKFCLMRGTLPKDELAVAFLGEQPTTLSPVFTGKFWDTYNGNGVTCGRAMNVAQSCAGSVEIKTNFDSQRKISFDWAAQAYENLDFIFYVDGKLVYTLKSSSTSGEPIFSNKTYILSAGSHTLKWQTTSSQRYGQYHNMQGYIKNLNLGIQKSLTGIVQNVSLHEIKGLIPNSVYSVRFVSTHKCGDGEDLEIPTSWLSFMTKNVVAKVTKVSNIKQASATLNGSVDGGDATIVLVGLKYKENNSNNWSDIPFDIAKKNLSYIIKRLKPSTVYNFCSYIQAKDCTPVYSQTLSFTTQAVEAQKPILKKLAQHSATLEGHVVFGDASIYQRGMQFRKYGDSKWEEVEDGGEEEVYILSKNNLEMNTTYQARTYIQAAGKDVVYSDILEFKTLNNYHKNLYSTSTQTTVSLETELTEVDDNVDVEYGFEYYIISDGFTKSQSETPKTEVHKIKAQIINGKAVTTLGSLAPQYKIAYRAYAKVGNQVFYFTSSTKEWDEIWTQKAFVAIEKSNSTQTTFTALLDIQKCNDDANITAIEYSIDNTENKNYSPCSKDFKIVGLLPNQKHNLNFRGTVNGLLCPLLIKAQKEFSSYEFTTKDINVSVKYSAITQTKATMKISVENGDATISNLCYKINSSDKKPLNGTITFKDLAPNTKYSITIYGSISGKEYSWSGFSFTTNPVIVNVSTKTFTQTSCDFSLSYNCGDATFVSSGIVYDLSSVFNNDRVGEGTILVKELLPNTTYYYKGYVETKESGRIYSSLYSFTTKDIVCQTSAATCISNRSATLNGNISCDAYSSAEFGFQWKQMENWNTEPAFTKGHKSDDGSISVSLVNGLLEPNTDYQYRAVVRYNGKYYYSNSWKTFRTESEYIYYPTSVYTMFRTDRENNRLILCGYYVAGSEEISTQGYEYWNNSSSKSVSTMFSNSNVIKIVTDQKMQYELNPEAMQDGVYSVRAFVQTASGKVEYGNTLTFEIQQKGVVGIENQTIDNKNIGCSSNKQCICISNANGYAYAVYTLNGALVKKSKVTSDYEEIALPKGNIYIVKIGSLTFKVSH